MINVCLSFKKIIFTTIFTKSNHFISCVLAVCIKAPHAFLFILLQSIQGLLLGMFIKEKQKTQVKHKALFEISLFACFNVWKTTNCLFEQITSKLKEIKRKQTQQFIFLERRK